MEGKKRRGPQGDDERRAPDLRLNLPVLPTVFNIRLLRTFFNIQFDRECQATVLSLCHCAVIATC